MLNKIIQILLIILFITLPLVNSHLLDFFGLSNIGKYFYVNGNYEFTKIIYFNILSSIILFFYSLKIIFFSSKKFVFHFPKILLIVLFSIIISSILSIYPEVSLFGNTDKAHSLLIFVNLIGIYGILYNSTNSFKKTLLFWLSLGLIPIIIISIKELYFQSYNYGDLSNRAFGTFGHPNYLALYLLLLLPIVNDFLVLLILGTIFLTKSIIAIILLLVYLLYFVWTKSTKKIHKSLIIVFISFVFCAIIFYVIKSFGYSKIHSFLSRFYIWQTTLDIIFSNTKTLLIGNGPETLGYIFDNFKSPYLYIFENFGFTADRPHNIFLNIFYHFGIFGLSIFIYLIYKLFKLAKSNYKISLILALIFLCFNYASISSYLIIILLISFLFINKNNSKFHLKNKKISIAIFCIICLFSIIGSYFSYQLYVSEILAYNGKYIEAQRNYIFGKKIYEIKTCKEELKSGNKSAEIYFYCGNIKYNPKNPKIGINYYKLGLQKLPDLWNKNSKYFNNIFIKDNPDILHRFFSKKYSNISKILEIINKNKEH